MNKTSRFITDIQPEHKELAIYMMKNWFVPFENEDRIKAIIGYFLARLTTGTPDEEIADRVEKIYDNAVNKYNVENAPVRYFGISPILSGCGTLLTFIRDDESDIKDGKMIFGLYGEDNVADAVCWVENIEHPELSELGNCVFELRGKTTYELDGIYPELFRRIG